MLVNETKNDLNVNLLASRHLTKKARVMLFACSGAVFVLATLMLLLEIFVLQDDGVDYVAPVLFFVFGGLLFVLALVYPLLLKRACKKMLQGKEASVTYTFREEGYAINAVMNDGTQSVTEGSYTAFTECREYSDAWLLYLNKATTFVLLKSGMKEGTPEELTAFLMLKLGVLYKTQFKR